MVNVFGAPPIDGLGTAGGFKIVIEDRGDTGCSGLQTVSQTVVEQAESDARPAQTCSPASAPTRPGCTWTSIARRPRRWASRSPTSSTRCKSTLARCTSTISIASAAPGRSTSRPTRDFRMQVDDLKRLKVRNARADGSVGGVRQRPRNQRPVMLFRYNLYSSAAINGNAPARNKLGRRRSTPARQVAEAAIAPSMRTNGPSWPFCSGRPATRPCIAFILAVVLVFLVLAAQYESWSLPLAVILVVPMCLLCSVAGVIVATWISISSRKSASSCWSGWRARTPF